MSISSSAERLAKISALPESGPGGRECAEALHGLMSILYDESGRNGLFGKTYPDALTEACDEDSFVSSARSPTAGIFAPGACWMLNMSEWTGWNAPCHSDDGVSSLSDILETGDHLRRYCLSLKACAGILRRAEKRGKELPEQLKAALASVVIQTQATVTAE